METSNSNNQTGKDCFLLLFNSFGASILFNSAFSPCFSNKGFKSPSWVAADVSCSSLGCSAASCSSYLSTYSGNSFLNVELLWTKKNRGHKTIQIDIQEINVLPPSCRYRQHPKGSQLDDTIQYNYHAV